MGNFIIGSCATLLFFTTSINQVVEMGGVQTLIFLSQSGNEEVKVSNLLILLIINKYKP